MKLIVVSLLALAPVLVPKMALARVVPTVQQVELTRENCVNAAEAQTEIAACEEEAGLSAEQLLSAAYFNATQKSVSPASKKALVKAERAWIAYRDADCKGFVSSQYEGGNGQGLGITTCINDRTLERVKAMQRY